MRFLLYIIFVAIFITSCNNSTKFEINGKIENSDGKNLVFNELLVNGTQEIKKVEVKNNGTFIFKHETDIPRFYQLAISENNFITLLIEPGEKITINAESSDMSAANIIGSEGSVLVQKINNQLASTKEKLDSIKRYIDSIESQDQLNAEIADINKNYAAIVNQQRDSSIAFIINNMNSLASIVALYQKIDDENFVLYKNRDIQYIKIVSEALEKKYPESNHVKALVADRKNLLKRYEQIVTNSKINELTKTKKVNSLPEIFLPNQSGDSISLNGVESKYVLLNFWATWNEESMAKNVELLELYKKYHIKGFEIYQVSLDTKIDNWINAINFDQLPWINVIDVDGRTSYYAKLYNVKTLPTSYLINSKGDIISVNPSKEQLISIFDFNLK